tara:strand:+ start:204 stop:380 length:177 start_codon:yes stop_codon:yes gene_type:complete
MTENELVTHVIAEIKRDIAMNNLLALKQMLSELLKRPDNKRVLKSFLSEFPELREDYM